MLWSYAVLAPVSKCYPPVRDRLFTRYSPVRHSNNPFRTEALPMLSPFDLHVLSTPPAFVLSQDQTLMFNPFPFRQPYSLRLAKASAFLPASWRFTHRILTVLARPHRSPLHRIVAAWPRALVSSVSFSRFARRPRYRVF